MGNVIEPKLELRLNSQYYETIEIKENEENKVILQQFENEPDTVYLILNDTQVTIPLDVLKTSVDTLKTLSTLST